MHLVTIFERGWGLSPNLLSEQLSTLYGSSLGFRVKENQRPLIIGNFVQTLDGIISWKMPGISDGGTISGFNDEDRFIMALLRSCADAVIVGAGTLRDDTGHVWTPGFIYPKLEQEFVRFRKHLGKSHGNPLTVIVTGSGRINLGERVFSMQGVKTVILTTHTGGGRLENDYGQALAEITDMHVLPGETALDPHDITSILQSEYGAKLILNEGGAQLFSAFLRARLIDELFLTVAPQIGGNATHRPHFAEEISFGPSDAPSGCLITVKRPENGSHLYCRYQF
jgi:riboflavin biosynthesis pyrimidine reductase